MSTNPLFQSIVFPKPRDDSSWHGYLHPGRNYEFWVESLTSRPLFYFVGINGSWVPPRPSDSPCSYANGKGREFSVAEPSTFYRAEIHTCVVEENGHTFPMEIGMQAYRLPDPVQVIPLLPRESSVSHVGYIDRFVSYHLPETLGGECILRATIRWSYAVI